MAAVAVAIVVVVVAALAVTVIVAIAVIVARVVDIFVVASDAQTKLSTIHQNETSERKQQPIIRIYMQQLLHTLKDSTY